MWDGVGYVSRHLLAVIGTLSGNKRFPPFSSRVILIILRILPDVDRFGSANRRHNLPSPDPDLQAPSLT